MAECKACGEWFGTATPQDLCPTCERALKRLGGYVEPVRHGRWEDWWPGIGLIMTGEEMLYRCSVCDAKYSTVENKYCPNCGAKMDGEEKR